MFWSWRLIPSLLQLRAGLDYSQYSFTTLVSNGTMTLLPPSDFGVANTTTRANALEYLSALNGDCGDAPNNVAPYPAATVQWTVEEAAKSSVASETYTATSYAAGSTAASKKAKRSFWA